MLTLSNISPSILKHVWALMDGERIVQISEKDAQRWREELRLDTPIFANEIPEHMLHEWEFAFNLGTEIPIEKYVTMSKPTITTRKNGTTWYMTCPCQARCPKCHATYPIFGKFCINDTETCDNCTYKYIFVD